MTKEEALAKIKELQEYFDKCDEMKVGFDDDEIFLLSEVEYEKYYCVLPHMNCCRWLRSPVEDIDCAALILDDGSLGLIGKHIDSYDVAVWPALRVKFSFREVGERFIMYEFPWIMIDKELAIAEVPIALRRFDESSNDYEKSEIRQFLFDWLKNRKVMP